MGKRGNKLRKNAKATANLKLVEALATAERLHTFNNENRQEEIEMERAYGLAEADGEFKDDSIPDFMKAPWEAQDNTSEEEPELKFTVAQKHLVLIEADHNLEYPELFLTVWINGTLDEEAEFTEMFARAGCQKAATLDEADLCVFVGGADVDPQLYGHVRWANTEINHPQDNRDLEVYAYCQAYGIPMVGVCRGAQFLHVMNGGTLFQDVDGHVGDHPIYDLIGKRWIDKTPSVHHQMCMPNPEGGMSVLATANVARSRRWWSSRDSDFISTVGPKPDCEAFFYRDSCALGFQGHPEYSNYPAYTVWCLETILNKIRHNPDLGYSDDCAVLRIKPDLLAERLTRLTEAEETKAKTKAEPETIETEVEVH